MPNRPFLFRVNARVLTLVKIFIILLGRYMTIKIILSLIFNTPRGEIMEYVAILFVSLYSLAFLGMMFGQ
jgi:hypothetical protein